jgi:hypothetical protein
MIEALQAAIGESGPLIVEHGNTIFFENCVTIYEKNVLNMIEKIKNIMFTRIEQTTERSFVLLNA